MNSLKSLLVVIDPTVERDTVVDRAIMLAKAADAKIHLLISNFNTLSEHSYIYEGVDGKFFETQRKLFEEHHKKILAQVGEEVEAANINVELHFTEHHHLAESIIEHCNKIKPDLLLKSTHHHSAIERSIITNTDWRLIRKCPCPLMLVKPSEWHADGSLVTAVDPLHAKADQAKLDQVLLASAKYLSVTLGAPLKVFHSFFPFVSTLFPMGGETVEHLERIRGHHMGKMRALTGEFDIPEDAIHLSEGDLVHNLITYVEDSNTNLLVMGALSRNFLERAIVGNTAEKILEDCPCDILVLKS